MVKWPPSPPLPPTPPHLNLPNIHLLVLFLHLLHAHLHSVHSGLGVLELLEPKVGLLHVEGLIPQSLQLPFVQLLLFQDSHGFLLDHVLWRREGKWQH